MGKRLKAIAVAGGISLCLAGAVYFAVPAYERWQDGAAVAQAAQRLKAAEQSAIEAGLPSDYRVVFPSGSDPITEQMVWDFAQEVRSTELFKDEMYANQRTFTIAELAQVVPDLSAKLDKISAAPSLSFIGEYEEFPLYSAPNMNGMKLVANLLRRRAEERFQAGDLEGAKSDLLACNRFGDLALEHRSQVAFDIWLSLHKPIPRIVMTWMAEDPGSIEKAQLGLDIVTALSAPPSFRPLVEHDAMRSVAMAERLDELTDIQLTGLNLDNENVRSRPTHPKAKEANKAIALEAWVEAASRSDQFGLSLEKEGVQIDQALVDASAEDTEERFVIRAARVNFEQYGRSIDQVISSRALAEAMAILLIQRSNGQEYTLPQESAVNTSGRPVLGMRLDEADDGFSIVFSREHPQLELDQIGVNRAVGRTTGVKVAFPETPAP